MCHVEEPVVDKTLALAANRQGTKIEDVSRPEFLEPLDEQALEAMLAREAANPFIIRQDIRSLPVAS